MAERSQPRDEVSSEQDLSVGEALEIAARAQQVHDYDVAETIYRRILDVAPDHPDALHLYGMLHHQTRRPLEAVRLIRRAIEIEPDEPGMHSNLGNVLFELDRPDLAARAYEMAIVLDPSNPDARNNLGVALRALRKPQEAEAVYREAVALDARHRDAWDNLGRLLAAGGRIDEAIACHARALELEPRNAGTRRHLIAAYAAGNETERALAIVHQWLRDEPANPSALHLAAALSGEDVPDRASDRYVEALFDGFADSFDHKLARLEYRAPQLVADAVSAACRTADADLVVLDAGCGTGLCGSLLRPFARELGGVDLSGRMLERAERRGVYDWLEQGELTEFLSAKAARYDLVVSADTLCYFGPLEPLFAAARLALRPGGRLVFSVEEEAGIDEHKLHPHGRYSHGPGYVRRSLEEGGFRILALDRDTLRMERGKPVAGLIVSAEAS